MFFRWGSLVKRLLLLLFIFAFTFNANTKNSGNTGKLIVKIINIKNDKGEIRSQLYNDPEAFPTEPKHAFKKLLGKIDHKKSIIVYDNIPYGEYAITVHHDEDLDGWMNKNFFGYPTEGYGISNNPKIILSLPSFDESKFRLSSNEMIVTIIMKD